eukprot:3544024-Pleurochrysis_carterae.AAC.1
MEPSARKRTSSAKREYCEDEIREGPSVQVNSAKPVQPGGAVDRAYIHAGSYCTQRYTSRAHSLCRNPTCVACKENDSVFVCACLFGSERQRK